MIMTADTPSTRTETRVSDRSSPATSSAASAASAADGPDVRSVAPGCWSVASASTPGTYHLVDLFHVEGALCDCAGFSYRRRCRYVDIAAGRQADEDARTRLGRSILILDQGPRSQARVCRQCGRLARHYGADTVCVTCALTGGS